MVTAFNISGGDSIINPASSFYRVCVYLVAMFTR